MSTIQAIYEHGVFRPIDPVELPENCRVEFEPRLIGKTIAPAAMERIYEILSRSYETGESDLAERHDEHQP
jgi:predicted DNA-binding antitoxin AbrB/MazE fold protein